MLKNYLKIAVRHLLRHRLFTAINVVGLALGAACCALIGLYLQHELSYDRFHRDPENVYRVLVENHRNEGSSLTATTPRMLAAALAGEFPEIASAVQFRAMSNTVGYNDKEYPATSMIFTASAFFEVFTFSSVQGDLAGALAAPNAAVLTQSFARKIFGTEDPLGKTLLVPVGYGGAPPAEVKVAALMADVPQNAHFKFDLVLPLSLRPQAQTGAIPWNMFEMRTYVRLQPHTDPGRVAAKLPDFVQRTGGDRNQQRLVLQRLTDIHLSAAIPFDDIERTNRQDLYVFAGIALLVLAIACINYMVLATARYTQRWQEAGVRKIVGATPFKLFLQFFIETAVIAAWTLPLALAIVEMAHRALGGLLGKELQIDYMHNQVFVWGNLFVLLFFTVVAGIYPALFFSKVNAGAMLKGQGAGVKGSAKLRQVLVVAQFGITIALLACVGTMYEQLQYTRNKDLGYQHDNLLVVNVEGLGKRAGVFKQAALAHAAIHAATLSSWLPGYLTAETIMPDPRGGVIETEFVEADCDLLETFKIQLRGGRDFDCNSPSDTLNAFRNGRLDASLLPRTSILLNETAVQALGLESPLGKELNYPALQGTVIGVIKDMHHRSLHYAIKPMVIRCSNDAPQLVVAYVPGQEARVLAHLKAAWAKLTPKSEFTHLFLNDHLRQLYAAEEKLMQMTTGFAALAIALSGLGLFGMAVFSIARRTKEIGIRKVLGVSVRGVVTLLSGDFIKLVLAANLLAWPAAWYAMNAWLQDFAYRITLDWRVFVLAGGVALVIALATVSTQAIKAALANPVDSLRYE